MKGIKIYLAVVTVLLVIAIGLGVYVWFTLQTLNTTSPQEVGSVSEKSEKSTSAQKEVATPLISEPITITKQELSPTQQKLLETLGFDEESFTITPSMIVCAENAVGKERFAQIIGGDSPSALESLKLLPCFKK